MEQGSHGMLRFFLPELEANQSRSLWHGGANLPQPAPRRESHAGSTVGNMVEAFSVSRVRSRTHGFHTWFPRTAALPYTPTSSFPCGSSARVPSLSGGTL